VDAAEARRTFRDVRLAHVGTVSPSGRPHVVPLWFVWLEEAVYLTCRRRSRVWRNVGSDHRVTVEIDRGEAWTEQAGVMLEGDVEALLPGDPAARRPLSAWFEKYRAELGGYGFAAYTEQVEHPVILRVRLDRIASWDHSFRPEGPARGT
jgi:hypothetical protein